MTTKNPPAKAEAPADPAAALAKLVEEFGPAATRQLGEVAKAFKIAEGVGKVLAVVKGAVPQIRPLQGNPLGFRTDKDKDGGYGDQVLAECATEALLRGLRLTGNEWNIIGGRCYVAQAGFARLVSELEGLTDLDLSPGIPVMKEGGAIVEYGAKWNLDGKPMSITRKIPIRVNSGMGADAILGKAKRKMLAAIYERVTGSVLSDGDVGDDVPMVPAGPSKPSQLAGRIAANVTPPPTEKPGAETDEFGQPIFTRPTDSLFPNPKGSDLPD